MSKVIIGTRSSRLALWQANFIKRRLELLYPNTEIELKQINTKGDLESVLQLPEIGGKGLFTKEIELELLEGKITLAVHSLKDLPTELDDGLLLGGVIERESVEDALIAKSPFSDLASLPEGATVATGSPRRKAQLLHLRKDLNICGLRGNINTRIEKFLASDWQAIVLAYAGLRRISLDSYATAIIPVGQMLPAAGQGALGIEIAADNSFACEIARKLNHEPTEIAVTAERAFLKELGGGCSRPIAAYCNTSGDELRLDGLLATEDCALFIRKSLSGSASEPARLGIRLAEIILSEDVR